MKTYKFLALITAITLLCSSLSTFASPSSNNDNESTRYIETVLDNYRQYRDMPDGYSWLTDDSGYAYMLLAEKIRTDYYVQPLMYTAYVAIGEILSEDDCISYLSVIMQTLDHGMDANITAQAKYDSVKNWTDYSRDAISLAAQAVGLDKTTEDLKYLQNLIGLSDATLEFLTSSVENAENFLIAAQKYEEHKIFLETVAEYAGERKLKTAARQLLELMQYQYLYQLDTAATEVKAVGKWTYSAHEELITDSFKVWLTQGKGQAGKNHAALADKLLQSCKTIKLAAGISSLTGDIFIGNEYRYLKELMMMSDISKALMKGINQRNPGLGDDLQSQYKLLKLQVPLLQSLCAVRIRGEYCASMLGQAHQTLFGLFAQDKEKAADFYEKAISLQEKEYRLISELFLVEDFTISLLWHCPQTILTRSNGQPLSRLYGLYPEISYPGEKEAIEKINAALKEGYQNVTDPLLASDSWSNPNAVMPTGPAGNFFSTEYLPDTRMDSVVISLLFYDSTWPESTLLPVASSRHYNFDPATGNLLSLSHIMDSSNAYGQLGELIHQKTPIYSYGINLDDTLADMILNFWNGYTASDNPISWYFTRDGINFTLHSIRDGINRVGDVSWQIPYEQLNGIVKSQYLTIEKRSQKGNGIIIESADSIDLSHYENLISCAGPGDGSYSLVLSSQETLYDVTVYGESEPRNPIVTLSFLSPSTVIGISCAPSSADSPSLSVHWTDGSKNRRQCLFGVDSGGELILKE